MYDEGRIEQAFAFMAFGMVLLFSGMAILFTVGIVGAWMMLFAAIEIVAFLFYVIALISDITRDSFRHLFCKWKNALFGRGWNCD